MVTAWAKEGEMDTTEEEKSPNDNNNNQTNSRDVRDVVEELIGLIESVKSIGEYRLTQRKESLVLLRRMKLLLPLLEEIRYLDAQIPDSCITCLNKLKKVFVSGKKLLKTCHAGSKIYLALETEAMMVRFYYVYDKLSQALDGFPYDEIGISEEVKEQLELMREQLKRGKKRTDTQDMELAMDMMVALSSENDRNGDCASIERLASKLGLRTLEELKMETSAIRKLVKERRGHNAEGTQQIIDLLSKLKKLAGIEQANALDDPVMPTKTLQKCVSISIPYEFLCPITLEIMTDPVIVATGQTYERESIQQWLDSNHRTCPKTGQYLSHTSLAPNVALRTLILQWCEKNNYQLPEKEKVPVVPENPSPDQRDEKMLSLVQNLSSCQLDVQRKAVTKIRMLSKESPENRVLIAMSGGIPPLVQLLSYPDSKIQEHAVTALLNLSIDESNKKLISDLNPIPAIIEVLQNGTIGAKENSAAALFSLSMLDENKAVIGSSNGIPPLVGLLTDGTIRGKKDAATALFNLTLNHSNKSRAIEAGIIKSLLKTLGDKRLDMVDETLSILLLLASHPDGRQELGQLSFIETIVNLLRDGSPKNKECAAAVLLELCSNNSNLLLAALQYGVYEHLAEVAENGTNRCQRKARAILQLMSKSEQI